MRISIYAVICALALGAPALGAEEELELATASLNEMVAAARGAYRAGDEARYRELVDAATAKFEPADVYFALGDAFMAGGESDLEEAVAAYEEALRNVEPSRRLEYPGVFYDMACSYARLGDAGKSLDCLRASLDAEPRFVDYARSDENLAPVREDPAFADLIAGAEVRAAEAEVANMTIKPGEPAPDFTLKDVYGSEYALYDFRGKPVVLNIWATWCPPCRLEIPDIVEFAREHDGEAVVLSISVDEPGEDVAGFAEEFGINYLVLLDDGEAALEYLRVNQGIPQTYFIDAEGVVRGHILGAAGRETFEARFARLVSADGD
jgi:peroxiredoxin